MIIRQEKIHPKKGGIKQEVKFAFSPTKMKRDYLDKDGEIIWMEKYVITSKAIQPFPQTKPDVWEWSFQHSERFTKSVLSSFEGGNS